VSTDTLLGPAWYADPDLAGQLPWWDVARWTPFRAPMPMAFAPAQRPFTSRGWRSGFIAIFVVMLAAAIASHDPVFYLVVAVNGLNLAPLARLGVSVSKS
jgi:hypothetical protein